MASKNNELKYELPESFMNSIIECVVELESSRDRLDDKTVKRHYELAKDLAGSCPTEESIREIEETTEADVVSWLLDLPSYLDRPGLTREALQHQRFWAGVTKRKSE
ncbi:MAG: hypothetical protein M1469_01625 [Bacteroidetes bacterium]|nr:hypothetical protein [Bacteroidota bacterium]